jgi:phosphotransferase system enzyme I (PtsP)
VTDDAEDGSPRPRQIDRVLDYLAFVATSHPLSVLLDEAPRRIAQCVDADVASIYLLEGDGRSMVMRGNVGFPNQAKGRVRLGLGEGITGRAVQIKHPIAADDAPGHTSYRGFPELDEERYPALAAVPILGTSGPLGAVVVQRRRERPFEEAEVSLLAALTAPISSAIRMARLLDDLRAPPKRSSGGTRKVTLPGVVVVHGRALGAVAALRRPALASGGEPDEDDAHRLTHAIQAAERALEELRSHAEDKLGARSKSIAESIDSCMLMLHDQRLRTRAFSLLEKGSSLANALGQVARDATRAASGSGDEFLMQRARDMEQLCDALLMMASPDSRATLPAKAVLVTDKLGIYDVLISARPKPAAFVLTEREPDERTRALLELVGVPALSDIAGGFRWMAPGDIALVDADHGLLIVNPSRADIAAFRTERRSSPGSS